MGFTRVVILLFTTSVLAKIYEYLNGSSPQPEMSHDTITPNPWIVCLTTHYVEFGLAAFALLVLTLVLVAIVVYLGSKCCCSKTSTPSPSRQVDTDHVRLTLMNASEACDKFLTGDGKVDEAKIQQVKKWLNASIDYLTKTKVE